VCCLYLWLLSAFSEVVWRVRSKERRIINCEHVVRRSCSLCGGAADTCSFARLHG